ncbi:MAG: orotidine-5'-phosphate decarboxylase [Omnitrophica WOR_2 bacterium]|jgi:orotidine-5'-phosphate decarboxylase
MNRSQLIEIIKNKRSYLCVGLDSDINKIPKHLLTGNDPVFEFNKHIIDATLDFAVAYKPNLAFYEARGLSGMQSFYKTIEYLNQYKDSCFTIADAKRGDIGNTSAQYASAFFDNKTGHDFDAVTVAPYMGEDSVVPFLTFKDKWVVILALTSNKGAADFQLITDNYQERLFEHVLKTASTWGSADNTMFVVGATRAEMLSDIRKIVPYHFLLVPGVGAQGGSLKEVAQYGLNEDCGILVNASRSIIFNSINIDFAEKAREEAHNMQKEMEITLREKGII